MGLDQFFLICQKRRFVFFIILFWSLLAWSQSRIDVIPKNQYLLKLNDSHRSFRGTSSRYSEEQCSHESLKEQLRSLKSSGSWSSFNFQRVVQEFFNECEDSIEPSASSSFENLVSLSNLYIDLREHSGIQAVQLTLKDGTTFKGLLGLKSDNKKRPLVVIRCGIFCNPYEQLAISAFTSLFESSPFHVLILGNLVSSEMINESRRVVYGGVIGGLELLEAAQIVKQSWSSKIHSLHAAGYSLGGMDALMASYYSSDSLSPIRLNSALAICSVTDIPKVFYDASINNISLLTNLIWKDELSRLLTDLDKDSHISGGIKVDFRYYTELHERVGWLIRVGERGFQNKLAQQNSLTDPFSQLLRKIKSRADLIPGNTYASMNDYSFYATESTVPTLALSAHNDSLLSSHHHLNKISQKGVPTLFTENGTHCAFGNYYGWPLFNTLVQEYILGHSPGFEVSYTEKNLHPRIGKDSQRMVQKIEWRFAAGQSQAKALIYLQKPPFANAQHEYQSIQVPVNLDLKRLPQNKEETLALERWANTNLRVVDRYGHILLGSTLKRGESYKVMVPDHRPF